MVKVISEKRKKEIAVEIIDKMFEGLNGKHYLITALIKSGCDWTHLNEMAVLDIPKAYAQCLWLDDDYLEKKKIRETEVDELKKQLDVQKTMVKNLMRELTEKENEAKARQQNLSAEQINLEYLIERDIILQKLEAGGVDNWEWYSESLNIEL